MVGPKVPGLVMSAPTMSVSAKNRKKDFRPSAGSATNKIFQHRGLAFGGRTVAGFRCHGSLRFWRQSPSRRRALCRPGGREFWVVRGKYRSTREPNCIRLYALAARDVQSPGATQGTMRRARTPAIKRRAIFSAGFSLDSKPINTFSFRAAESCFKAFMNSPGVCLR